jgi:hypothetical protein
MAALFENKHVTQIRTMEITVFSAYILFIFAGLLFYGMVDDSPFVPLMQAHLEFRAAWFTVEGGAVVALLAFLAGGVPIGLALLKSAVSAKRRDILLLVGIPLVLLAIALTLYAMITLFAQGSRQTATGSTYTLFIVANVIFLVTLITSPITLVLAVIRSEINGQLFHMARLPAIIMTLAMVGMLLATIGWGIIAYAYEPQNFNTAGILGLTAGSAWLTVVGLMLSATIIASAVTLRYRSHDSIA